MYQYNKEQPDWTVKFTKQYVWGNTKHPFTRYMIKRVRYTEWLQQKHDFSLNILIDSLERDGRFYGAEKQQGLDDVVRTVQV